MSTTAQVLIYDLGDILFSWSSKTTTAVSPKTLRAIMSSPTWFEYEQGVITQQDCLDRISRELSIAPKKVQMAFGTSRAVTPTVNDRVQRGREYLDENAGHLDSVTNHGHVLKENFAQLLILEATGDRKHVRLVDHPTTWNFFQGQPCLTTAEFPCDLDTTSLALTVTSQPQSVVSSVMDEMLNYVNTDGIVQTYFDHSRPRCDPVVCVNVLTLFYTNDRGHQLPKTLAWVKEVLTTREYTDGTRYYSTGECFLFFLTRLLDQIKDKYIHQELHSLLRSRVQERVGSDGDALALAMRVLTCAYVGIQDDVDLQTLLSKQCADGGWENGWVYKYGKSGVEIGNRGLVTALAVKAVEAVEALQSEPAQGPSKAQPRYKKSRSYVDELSSVVRRHMYWPWFRADTQ